MEYLPERRAWAFWGRNRVSTFCKAAGGAIVALCAGLMTPSIAAAWLEPGDIRLRHDLTLLADAGLIQGPITDWPLNIPTHLDSLPASTPAHLQDAAARVLRVARHSGAWVGVDAAHEPIVLRGFQDSPRAEGELTLGYRWQNDYAFANLEL